MKTPTVKIKTSQNLGNEETLLLVGEGGTGKTPPANHVTASHLVDDRGDPCVLVDDNLPTPAREKDEIQTRQKKTKTHRTGLRAR